MAGRRPELSGLFTSGKADLVFAPNSHPEGSIIASRSTEHGAFDDDGATVKATLARMLAAAGAAQPVTLSAPDLHFHHGSSSTAQPAASRSTGSRRCGPELLAPRRAGARAHLQQRRLQLRGGRVA